MQLRSVDADKLVVLRQQILYAEQMWRAQRMWALVLLVFGFIGSGGLLVANKGRIDNTVVIFFGYIPCALILGGLLLYYRSRNYAQVMEGGLKISNLLSSTVIDYGRIRSARVQPLERHFEGSRKRYIRAPTRPLMSRPALFVRVRGDDAQLGQLRRKLGGQLIAYDIIALPIPDPDAMAWEVTSRLPGGTGMNLGGQRRRKRGR
ncbi:MAG TPA: hypothetical protein VKF14_07280 [Candidatus Dormibacteraeota bacterium]|nr:hypothetical protein [Candidatus Dormibacteraeota bacterium]